MRTAEDPTKASLRLLFVCTANVARSPYAERRVVQLAAGLDITVRSAGVPGYPGRPMDEQMAAQLRSRQISSRGHASRSITADLMNEADVVLTFEYAHRLRLVETWPEHATKVFILHQFAEALERLPAGLAPTELAAHARQVAPPDSISWDVRDPHGLGRRAAKRCADEIDAALVPIIRVLSELMS